MKPFFKLLLALMLSVKAVEAFALAPLGCLIEPSQIAQVGSQVVGVTETVNVERGDIVQKGQILATLKSDYERANVDIAKTRSQLEADVRSAEANLELARITEKRGVDLVQKKFLSQQALDKSHAETQLAEQRLVQAKEQLRISGGELTVARAQLGLRSIRAPFDGIVAERFVWPGERVEDKPLFKIVKINPLRVEIVAPVELYGQVEKDQTIQIKPDLAKTGSVDAKVVLVDKVIDGASNTFRIRAEIDNKTAEIPSGLRCKALITANSAVKNPNTAASVSDSPVAGSAQNQNKHSFELKPFGDKTLDDKSLADKSLSDKSLGNMLRSDNLKLNGQTPDLQKQDSQPLKANQFSLRMDKMDKFVPMPSTPPTIKMPSDKGTQTTPAVSIEEQFRQLQQQRDSLKNGSFKPTATAPRNGVAPDSTQSKSHGLPFDNGLTGAVSTKSVAYQANKSQAVMVDNATSYPSALSPQVMRQVTPMPIGVRRVTFRDSHKTFPIRRVVVLEPNTPQMEYPSQWQGGGQPSVNNANTLKVDWQSNISQSSISQSGQDGLAVRPKLKMDRALFGFGGYSNQSSSTSH